MLSGNGEVKGPPPGSAFKEMRVGGSLRPPRCQSRFSTPGTDWGLLGQCIVLKQSRGKGLSLARPFRASLPAQGAPRVFGLQAGVAVTASPRAGCSARGNPNAGSGGFD